jgi:2-C-methyl-D-erythritol 4-phosphate cytidylyltransferase
MSRRAAVWAVVVAAGRGRRLGAGQPKALVRLRGRPLLVWSLELFRASGVDGVVVAAPAGSLPRFRRLVGSLRLSDLPVEVVPGGRRRQDSVRKALEHGQRLRLPHDTVVLVHDAARPLASRALVRRVLEPFRSPGFRGCVVPLLPVEDTLKRVRGRRVVDTVDRSGLARAQTPQGLRLGLALALHQVAREERLQATDEAMLAEHAGLPVRWVPGEPWNLKITTAEDLKMADKLWGLRVPLPRAAGRGR